MGQGCIFALLRKILNNEKVHLSDISFDVGNKEYGATR
jgi:hypothetical protein